jgi:propanol-preferring alcohol dehydrogenase
VTQVAKFEGRDVFAFTRPLDHAAQVLARQCGAVWAGDSTTSCPQPLDAAIIFAPAGELIPLALRAVRKGGVVVCAGIHMSDVPSFPYQLLWGERILRSVANLTRNDGAEFMKLAAQTSIYTKVHEHPLEHANEALAALRSGAVTGAAVLRPQ